ncbi:PopZ family protein [Hansschlegelia beijingensis]|uniref:PopZ family protein n=1 Tax=Hansschlegelia beijingensis TaxID=1133344 RepID=UPI00387F3122
MSTPAKAQEPTMEEILASIRRIISDDEPTQALTPPKAAAKAAPKAETVRQPDPEPEPEAEAEEPLGQDDIDAMFASFDAPSKPELAAPKRPEPRPAPVMTAEDLDVFELTEDMAEEPGPAPQTMSAAPKTADRPLASRPAESTERLLSEAADDAVSNAFGSLANTILSNNARTLDDIVKEMLRPMLRAWLDDNLPPLVERLVRNEIERVARGGR